MSKKDIGSVEEEEEIKHYVFIKSGREHYAPQILTSGEATVHWVFPVPEPNAVGVLDDESNGIVFITFGDYGMVSKCRIVAKDYLDGDRVYGVLNYHFSPNYTNDTIAYSQCRVAVIANIKTGEAFYADCGLSRNDCLQGIRFLDPQEKLLVIVKSIRDGKPYKDSYLHAVKLEGQEFIDAGWSMYIGETDCISSNFPMYNMWHVHDRRLFVYDREWHKIECTDGRETQSYPFSEVFNANSGRIAAVKDIAIHPALPFGAIIEEDAAGTQDLIVLRWDITNPKKKDEQVLSFGQDLNELRHLFGLYRLTLAYPSFSPDGNWYVVGLIASDEPQSPHFVAIPVVPVDKKRPYFLDVDNVVILGQVAGMTSIAWTSEPTSYVVSNGEILHKWDLDELPNARVFVMPEAGEGRKKGSIFRKAARLFGVGKQGTIILKKVVI
jgi:hypothetical protein